MPNIKSVNDVLLSIGSPLQEYLETDSGFKLILAGGEYRHEWNVSVKGKVVSLPIDHPYNKSLKIGDTVYFSYFVCSNRSFDSDAEFFNPEIDEAYLKKFYDGYGNKIQIIAVPSIIDKQWVCSYIDKRGEFIHGISGTEKEMERWLSQFKFGNVQKYRFENLIELDGEQYWKCHPDFIFAKEVSGKPVAVGDYLLLEPIKQKVSRETLYDYGITIPDAFIEANLSDRAILLSGGNKLGLKKGQIIGYDGKLVQKYDFDNKPYIIIESNRVFGIWE